MLAKHAMRFGLVLLVLVAFVACSGGEKADSADTKTAKVEKKSKASKTSKRSQSSDVELSFSEADKAYLMDVGRKAFETWVKEKKYYEPTDVPANLRDMKVNRVFATIYKKGEWRGCVSAQKANAIDTVVHAVVNTCKDRRFEDPRPDELSDFRVELSFLQPFEAIATKDPKEIEQQLEPGVHGISIVHENGRKAFFLPYVFVKRQRTTITWLERICKKAGLPQDAWKDPQTTIYKYHTINFIEDKAKGKPVDLYRYKVELDSLSATAVPDGIKLATKWFINHENSAKKRFWPGHDDNKKPIRSDSLTLQLMALSAIGYADTTDTFKSDLGKIYTWFMQGISDNLKQDKDGLHLESPDANSLEATLVFGEALVNTAGLKDQKKLAAAVAAYLRTALDPKTGLAEKFAYVGDGKLYAIFVMAKLAQLTGDAKDKAHAKALYDAWFESGKPWSLAAVAAVDALDKSVYDAMLKEAQVSLRQQITKSEAKYRDYIGAFETDHAPTAKEVAVFTRGMVLAYAQIDAKDGKLKADLLDATMFAVRFLLEQQFTEVSAFYIEHYEKILGSFKRDILINASRLDDTALPLLVLVEAQVAMGDELAKEFEAKQADLVK